MSTADFEAAGIYDPNAPNAAERLELLDWLLAQGVTSEEICSIDDAASLFTLAGDIALRSGRKHSTRDLQSVTGLDEDTLSEMQRAVGYPELDPDEPIFTDQDLAGFMSFVAARSMFSDDAVIAFTRTLGASLARIADAASSMFVADVEGDLVASGATELERAQTNLDAVRLLDALHPTIEAVFRAHVQLAIDRGRITRLGITLPVGTNLARIAVGFVDLAGYTSLSRGLDARQLSDLVGRFEAMAGDTALAHDGRVVKLIGDAVMYTAVDPHGGVAIARDLLEEFRSDTAVRPHGGVAFGEVLARGGDYYGPVVNTAARLSEIAVPGEVLVTREIAASVEGLDPAGRRMLKGFDEPMELYALTAD